MSGKRLITRRLQPIVFHVNKYGIIFVLVWHLQKNSMHYLARSLKDVLILVLFWLFLQLKTIVMHMHCCISGKSLQLKSILSRDRVIVLVKSWKKITLCLVLRNIRSSDTICWHSYYVLGKTHSYNQSQNVAQHL